MVSCIRHSMEVENDMMEDLLMYAVWTVYQGNISTRVFKGSKRECKQYIKQANEKGSKAEFRIVEITKYG